MFTIRTQTKKDPHKAGPWDYDDSLRSLLDFTVFLIFHHPVNFDNL